jgi:hypothetical protein
VRFRSPLDTSSGLRRCGLRRAIYVRNLRSSCPSAQCVTSVGRHQPS